MANEKKVKERGSYQNKKNKTNHNFVPRNDESTEENTMVLEGRNVVMERLKSGQSIEKIMIQRGLGGSALKIAAMARENGIYVQEVSKDRLDEISLTKNHQGVIAYVSEHLHADIDDILQIARDRHEKPFVLVLDHIEDPHNLGALIRTAECAGMHGVIIPKRRASGLTPVVAKASAGALSHMAVARVSNIGNALLKLKEAGLWVYAAAADGKSIYGQVLKTPAAVVIGSEGHGVSELIRKKSDYIISVPLHGQIPALNASAAAAVIVYEFVRPSGD